MGCCLLKAFEDSVFISRLANQFSQKRKVDNKVNMRRHISERVNSVKIF